jgi:A/G-specific adenine glycosylase
MKRFDVAPRIVAWQRTHGRHSLPWQATRDPYRVWLSEIMLQQTQVATVLGYYERFLARFPAVGDLAAASEDEVLGLWSGLGYYSRARNLHRAAQAVMRDHGGCFPQTAQALQTLPGIGRSTAAAIAAFCFSERVAILDGNVKRVLARALAFDGDLASAAQERRLWDLAQGLVPADSADMPAYTQGLMDLGATVCLARGPNCLLCPLQDGCEARSQGRPEAYPVRTRKLRRTAHAMWLLVARRPDGAVWLEKRPSSGIWAGLHGLPVFASAQALQAAVPPRLTAVDGPPFVHALTHKDLHLHPVHVQWGRSAQSPGGSDNPGRWVEATQWTALGLPAPMRRLLEAGG